MVQLPFTADIMLLRLRAQTRVRGTFRPGRGPAADDGSAHAAPHLRHRESGSGRLLTSRTVTRWRPEQRTHLAATLIPAPPGYLRSRQTSITYPNRMLAAYPASGT